jgi:hypothetical protein
LLDNPDNTTINEDNSLKSNYMINSLCGKTALEIKEEELIVNLNQPEPVSNLIIEIKKGMNSRSISIYNLRGEYWYCFTTKRKRSWIESRCQSRSFKD